MRNSLIATAVASILGTGLASAAPLPYGTAYNDVVFLSGSSAFRSNLENQLNGPSGICQPGTYTKFSDSLGAGFLAYTCQVLASLPSIPTIQNDTILIYYRTSGGSVWGPGPIAKNVAVSRLALPTQAACGPIAAANTCAVTGPYTLNTDTAAGAGLTTQVPDWGVSDVDSARLTGENWVNATSGAGRLGATAPSAAQLSSLTGTTSPLVGQVFSVIVNQTGPAGALTSLSKQDLRSIFSGNYTDWSQVPNAARTGFLSAGAIKLCRRDAGSGTQTLASVFFNGATCSKGSYAFPVPNGTSVIQNNSTGALLTCVNTGTLGIGITVVDDSASLTQMVANGGNVKRLGYDGLAPTKVNAANGSYEYYAEAVSVIRPTLAAGNTKDLITGLQTKLQDVSLVASTDNIVAIPNLVASNVAAIPVASTGTPVAIGTTGGNACFGFQSVN